MKSDSRRTFFGKLTALTAAVVGAPKLLAAQMATQQTAAAQQAGAVAGQQTSPPAGKQSGAPDPSGDERPRRSNHTHSGIYYFSGTGANDGYGKDDHVLVTDPFEKHVSRTMDALKKNVERAGSTMDDIIHLQVFICLPLADSAPTPTGTARFEAHKAQYEALNKIYGTYFSPGKAPSRACMAVEWIPGDSLIEIVGTATVVNSPAQPAGS